MYGLYGTPSTSARRGGFENPASPRVTGSAYSAPPEQKGRGEKKSSLDGSAGGAQPNAYRSAYVPSYTIARGAESVRPKLSSNPAIRHRQMDEAAGKIQGAFKQSPKFKVFKQHVASRKIQGAFRRSPKFERFNRDRETKERLEKKYAAMHPELVKEPKVKISSTLGGKEEKSGASLSSPSVEGQAGAGGAGSSKPIGTVPQGHGQPPHGQPPYGQPPYGQPPYGQPYGSMPPQPYGIGYGHPMYGNGSRRRRNRHSSRRRRDGYSDSDSYSSSETDSYDSDDSYDNRRRRRRRKRGRHRDRRRSRRRRRRHRDDRSDRSESSGSSDADTGDFRSGKTRRTATQKPGRPRGNRGKGTSSLRKRRQKGKAKSSQEEYDRNILKYTKNISDGQTLIQQQHIAAARIQAFMRMRQQNSRWVNVTYPYLIRFRYVTSLVNEQLIEELLEDEIIPDVLIEIFSHAGDDEGNDPFRPNPEQDRQVWSIWTELMEETVEELSDMTARLVIRGFVNSYLQTRREEQQTALDPLSAVLEDYINEVADAETKKVVADAVQDMVQAYLRQQTADDFLNTTLQPLIEEVAMLAVDDIEVENVVNNMISDYLQDTSAEVAQESFLEMRDVIFDERQSRQYADVASATSRIFDNASLRMLIRALATNNESILMREYMDRLASGIMLRTMFSKLSRVHEQERLLEDNVPLRHFHQELTARIALRKMIMLLPGQLDKDEAEIDAREDLDGFSLDEEKEKSEVAVKLQARFRGRSQRMRTAKKIQKEQEEAAVIVQSRIRSIQARKKLQQEKIDQARLYGDD